MREGREPRVGEPFGFCDAIFLKADIGETRYAREPLRKRVQGDAAKQRISSVRSSAAPAAACARGESRGLESPLAFATPIFKKLTSANHATLASRCATGYRRAKQRKQRNLVGPKQRGAGGRVREGREPRVGEPVGFCDANFQKADVGETRYAREPLRNRVRRAKQRKQRNLVGPKQRGAGGRVREGRLPRVGEPVGFCRLRSIF